MKEIERARNSKPPSAIADDKTKKIQMFEKMVHQKQKSLIIVPVRPKSPIPKASPKSVERLKEFVSAKKQKEVLVLKKHGEQQPQDTPVSVHVPPKSPEPLKP